MFAKFYLKTKCCTLAFVGCEYSISLRAMIFFFECDKCAILLSASIFSQWVGHLMLFTAKISIVIHSNAVETVKTDI